MGTSVKRAAPAREGFAALLPRLFDRWHLPEFIGNDPLRWPRAAEGRADREVAAFLASAFAYGNVKQIDRSLASLFARLGRSPAAFLRDAPPARLRSALEGFVHRFNGPGDTARLLAILGAMLREEDSIEGFWARTNSGSPAGEPISRRAARFIAAALERDPAGERGAPDGTERDPLLFLLPMAGGPSACKRLHLFLRWVVRPADGIDLGLWTSERPAALEYPVDTHILRIARYLGATRRKAGDAKAREEITGFFRRFAPEDPVRFDFALCRLGILRQCPPRSRPDLCARCELEPACLRRAGLIAD